jgi:hypothetical protein
MTNRREQTGCSRCGGPRSWSGRAYCAPCSAAVQREYNVRLKAEVIAAYGGACTCCGETDPVFLTVDHVNNDGAEHRKAIGSARSGGLTIYAWLRRQGYPTDGFQLLCRNCNWAKHAEGVCPHARRRLIAQMALEAQENGSYL